MAIQEKLAGYRSSCVNSASKEQGNLTRSLPEHSRVLTVRGLSDYLRVHPSTVYRLLKTKQLPAFKVGSDWRFNIEDIDRWRLRRTAKPIGKRPDPP